MRAEASYARPARCAPPSTVDYFAGLAADLRREAEALGVASTELAGLDRIETGDASFQKATVTYQRCCHMIADALHRRFTVAQSYWSMEEFWQDAARQEHGKSDATFWDIYENGYRRRMEQLLATTYGVSEAVMVTSGMAAIDASLRCRLRPGCRLLIHKHSYFETSELIDQVLIAWGVEAVAVDVNDPEALAAAVDERPDAALVESVLNGPSVDVPYLDVLTDAGVPVLLDNSALGVGLPASVLPAETDAAVIESGTKYLCREASMGVVVGSGTWVDRVRDTVRRCGMALQGRALHHLRPGEARRVAHRLAIHTDRLHRFVAVLRDIAGERLVVTTAADGAAGRVDPLARAIQGGAGGCLAFVRHRSPVIDSEDVYRTAVAHWSEAVSGRRVRAGFGWTDTSVRAYGNDRLNTAAGAAFVRVSVGIEPPETVESMAAVLAEELTGASG